MNIADRGQARAGAAPMEREAGEVRPSRGFLAQRTLIVAATGAAVVGLLLAVWQVAQILLLIFASLLFGIFLRTLAVFVSDHTPLSTGWSLGLVVLTLLGATVLIGALYGPALADGFYQMSRQLPSALDRLRGGLGQYAWGPALLDALSRAGSGLTDPQQMSKIAGIFSTAFGALGSVLVVFVVGLYFAADPGLYINGTARLFPEKHRGRVCEAFGHVGHALRWWLIGRIAAMLAVGVLTFAGLAILGVPFAFVLALVNVLLDFIPNIGPLIAAVPAIMVGLSQDGMTALYVAILYFVIQSLEGYLITPYIQQRIVSLPPALLMASQLVMGAGFGILGLLLAPPLAVATMVLVQMLYLRDVLGEKVDLP
ncbi:AI-2E family transporter [Methylomagnum sp.]